MPSIKGIKMTPAEYQKLNFVVTVEEQAGWGVTQANIRAALYSVRHPSKQLQKDMKELDHKMKRDG